MPAPGRCCRSPLSISGNGDRRTFYNVYTDEEKISLTGTKQWNDYNDAMGLRQELPQGEVNSDTNNVFGLTVERYRVREDAIAHYEPDDASRDGALVKNNAFAIENTLVGSVNIQGTKTWEGEIGKEPELTLERRPAGSSEEWKLVANAKPVWSDTEKTTWRFTYTNMDKYDEQGVLLEYRVRETVPDGYDVFYTDGTAEDTDAPDGAEETTVAGLQITNVRRVALSVEKFWNGETPAKDAAVQVGLYRTTDPEMVGSAEGEAVTEEAQGTDGANRTAELNAENDWKATFAELPKYDATHALYYYYALELNAEGKPVENDGKITYGESDYRVSYVFEDGVTEITNR